MTNCTFLIIHIRIVLKHLFMSEAEDRDPDCAMQIPASVTLLPSSKAA